MPTKKWVGSGLTKREEVYYSLDEVRADPALLSVWKEEPKLEELEAQCIEILKDHNCPWCLNAHALLPDGTWHCLKLDFDISSLLEERKLVTIKIGPEAFGYPDDSAPQIAAKILRVVLPRVRNGSERLRDPECPARDNKRRRLSQNRELLVVLKERLFWKLEHEKAAQEHYRRLDHLHDAVVAAAGSKTSARQKRLRLMAHELKQCCSFDWLQTATDSAIAQHFRVNILPSIAGDWDQDASGPPAISVGALARYVAELRQTNSLPGRKTARKRK